MEFLGKRTDKERQRVKDIHTLFSEPSRYEGRYSMQTATTGQPRAMHSGERSHQKKNMRSILSCHLGIGSLGMRGGGG